MQRDLKLYFEKTEKIANDLNAYLRAVTTMETVLKNVCKKLSHCEGKSIDAILDTKEDLEKDIKKCKNEIKDLYDLFQGYNTDMQNIMEPKDKSSMMRVDRNDIAWNKYQISQQVEIVHNLKVLIQANSQGYAYGVNELTGNEDDEEIKKQQRNGAKIDEIFNTIVPSSYAILKQNMDDIDNFHETKVIPFENMDDTYASKAGKILKTYEGNLEWFVRIAGKVIKARADFENGARKALWDMLEGTVKLGAGLLVFDASVQVLAVCKLLDMDPPKWASHVYEKGIESAKMFVSLKWIPALGQQIMDSVEEDGIFYASGYTVGSLIGAKGLDKLGKAAKVAVQGTKTTSILKTATCADDFLNAGVNTIDDLLNAGVRSLDDLINAGVKSLDDLVKIGIKSIDDLVKLGVKSADELAKLGITSVEQLKKIGINSMDDLAKLGITSKEELAKVGVKSADDFVESGTNTPKPYANSRPSYGKGQVDQVWENAKDPVTGKVYDPTGKEITWDKSKPRKGQWDMGHIPGEKYSDMHKLYMDGIISKEEFLKWYRDPANYRPELPSTNRSHLYE
ncbi:HNH/ENDO VII family nuclease [Anaerosacchariphilus polymeriproducens]|uniref:HNH/ENDO VII family nuclease n=1 Tax=Anaerosacchariphilus polymeriproducens TaxID=1812858 RepID=UPI001961DBE9|nr:HNH/ENDO VII family nuclease [Anaerosacchariphilus polymeriproducens]